MTEDGFYDSFRALRSSVTCLAVAIAGKRFMLAFNQNPSSSSCGRVLCQGTMSLSPTMVGLVKRRNFTTSHRSMPTHVFHVTLALPSALWQLFVKKTSALPVRFLPVLVFQSVSMLGDPFQPIQPCPHVPDLQVREERTFACRV
jgi:hypothetical protein